MTVAATYGPCTFQVSRCTVCPCLSFRDDDVADFRQLVHSLGARPEVVARAHDVVRRIWMHIGELDAGDSAVSEVNDPDEPEHGLIAMMALVAVADDVHQEYLRRGVSTEVAWKSLSDLGQQVHIHRVVHGRFGLSSQSWCAANFTARLLWLGRLQFALEKDLDHATGGRDTHVLGVHIPESGPLLPDAIDESLCLARTIGLPVFRDHAPRMVTLHSWLLDPGVIAGLSPSSNMSLFARRFELFGEPQDAFQDALFFGFHIESRHRDIQLDSLPQRTSLERAIVNRLRGDGVGLYSGRLKDWPECDADSGCSTSSSAADGGRNSLGGVLPSGGSGSAVC